MALPKEEWLHLAKRHAVHSQGRYPHDCGSANVLVVGNQPDRYWAYCQRCKEGSLEMKEHVMLSVAPAVSRDITLPNDLRRVDVLDEHELDTIARFLVSKNMDFLMFPINESEGVKLPNVWYSAERRRLLIKDGGKWLGRDTTGRVDPKWLTYNGQHALFDDVKHPLAVITEDPFSMYKVRWAARKGNIPVSVYCSLGTKMHDELFIQMLENHTKVSSFYDGDHAGWEGCAANNRRLRAVDLAFVLDVHSHCARGGFDPKDYDERQLNGHLNALINLM